MTPFQMPQAVFDPSTGRMVPVSEMLARAGVIPPAKPIPFDIGSAPQVMPPAGGTQGLVMPPARPPQMTESPSFMDNWLQAISDMGGLQTNLGPKPRGIDSFLQNLIVSGFNTAATGRARKRAELTASNEALAAQNVKDRDATRARNKELEDRQYERLIKKQDATEAEKAWLRRYEKEQAGRVQLENIRAGSRAEVAGLRGAGGKSGLTGGTIEEVRAMFTPEALNQAARMFAVTGKFPSYVRGPYTFPMQALIQNTAAELYPGLDLSTNAANYAANKKALAENQALMTAVEQFSNTARSNANLVRDAMSRIPDFGSRWGNTPWRTFKAKGSSDPAIAQLVTAVESVVNEYGRLINNPRLVGQQPIEAVNRMRAVIDSNMPVESMESALETFDKESANRYLGIADQNQVLMDRLAGLGQSAEGRIAKTNDDVASAISEIRAAGITSRRQLEAAMARDPRKKRDLYEKLGSYGFDLVMKRLEAASGGK